MIANPPGAGRHSQRAGVLFAPALRGRVWRGGHGLKQGVQMWRGVCRPDGRNFEKFVISMR